MPPRRRGGRLDSAPVKGGQGGTGFKLDPKKLEPKQVRLGLAGLVVAVAIAIGAVALLGGGSGNGSSESGSAEEAVALSESELLARASDFSHPVYWVGPAPDRKLRAQLDLRRAGLHPLLTGGAEAGDPQPDFLAVGTYPVPDAEGASRKAAKESGEKIARHDGYEVLSVAGAKNAYVVFDASPASRSRSAPPSPAKRRRSPAAGCWSRWASPTGGGEHVNSDDRRRGAAGLGRHPLPQRGREHRGLCALGESRAGGERPERRGRRR